MNTKIEIGIQNNSGNIINIDSNDLPYALCEFIAANVILNQVLLDTCQKLNVYKIVLEFNDKTEGFIIQKLYKVLEITNKGIVTDLNVQKNQGENNNCIADKTNSFLAQKRYIDTKKEKMLNNLNGRFLKPQFSKKRYK